MKVDLGSLGLRVENLGQTLNPKIRELRVKDGGLGV